jgi:hypothetical protein
MFNRFLVFCVVICRFVSVLLPFFITDIVVSVSLDLRLLSTTLVTLFCLIYVWLYVIFKWGGGVVVVMVCFRGLKNNKCPWIRVRVMLFNATFNNNSIISWRSVLLVEETGVPGENQRPTGYNWQTLPHNVVSSTPRLSGDRTHNSSYSVVKSWYIK